MKSSINLRRWCAVPAVVALTAVGLTACSDDSGSGGDEDVDTSVLGEENKATGDAFKVGFVYDGESETVDESAALEGAEAVVDYANTYLGGIGGRKLELDVCATGQTPAGATACVSQMAKNEMPFVLNGRTGQSTVYPGLAEEGIGQMIYQTLEQVAFTTPSINLLTNGAATILATAKVAAAADADEIVLVLIDVPAATGPFEALTPFFENQGVKPTLVKIPPGTPDMTPALSAALESDPGMVSVVGDENFCSTAFKALQDLAYDGIRAAVNGCLTPENAANLTNVDGTVVMTVENSDPDEEETKIYEAIIGGREGATDIIQPAYAAVLAFARAMQGYEGEATTEGIQEALAGAKDVPLPLGGGITFTCDKMQVTLTPSVCSTDILKATLGADAQPKEYELIDGSDLL